MSIKIINTWTNTEGNGEVIIKELHTTINLKYIKGISSLGDFISTYTLKNGKFDGKYNSVKVKLDKLEDILSKIYINNPDPIIFLLYLYYEEKLPIRDISARLKDLGIEYPDSSLFNLLTKTLKLELRDKYENTDTKVKKDRTKAEVSRINIEKQDETKIAINRILLDNKGENIGFNYDVFKNKKNKNQRIIYLLYNFSYIKEENQNNLHNFLKKLNNGGLGGDRITNVLKTIINTHIIINNGLNIDQINLDSKLIWEILKQKKS